MNYRKKIDVEIITFPEGFEEEDRGLKNVCCKKFTAFADLTSTDSEKNDRKGVKVKISDLADSVTFTIEKCGTAGALTQLGEVAVFPQDALARGFMYDWRQYASTFGFGGYTIRVDFTISGETGGYVIGEFDLIPFTVERAQGWTRIWATFNTNLVADERKQQIDFTGSNFEDMLRVEGLFGKRQTNTEAVHLISKGYVNEGVKVTNPITYELESNPLSICSTRLILDLYFIGAETLYMSDHNRQNHDYLIFDIPVVIKDGESPDITYFKYNREAEIKQTFVLKQLNERSHFNKQ